MYIKEQLAQIQVVYTELSLCEVKLNYIGSSECRLSHTPIK